MELREGIRTTGAVREFTDTPVDRATVAAILDDARFAPSGGNRQPWRVAVVEDAAIRRSLRDLMQPTWDEYVAATRSGQVPFNSVDYVAPDTVVPGAPNSLLERIESIPVVLAVVADLRAIVATHRDLDRTAIVPGASIYPFCWNILLAARDRGLGGVLTTFLSRREPEAAAMLGLPEHHALVATIFLGDPVRRTTRLTRHAVGRFASIDRFDGAGLEAGVGE